MRYEDAIIVEIDLDDNVNDVINDNFVEKSCTSPRLILGFNDQN